MSRLSDNKKTINNYWTNREEMSARAKEHVEHMEKFYKDSIDKSVLDSRIFGYPNRMPALISESKNHPQHLFCNTDTVSALFDNDTSMKIALLNFASYKNPGGGFLNGSKAQEEMLCHESTLYNVISDDFLADYYDYNNEHKNRALYNDRAIYSPDILFIRDGREVKCDVVTCAAPNLGTFLKYNNLTPEAERKILEERMQFIANILEENEVEIFIAGAFGCGVFACDPYIVSDVWKNLNYGKSLKRIIHPVPGNDKNKQVFEDAFKKEI